MTRKKLYLILQAVVCVLLAAQLSLSAVSVCRKGLERRAQNPQESIYTREEAAEKLSLAAPLAFAGIGLLMAGVILGVNGDSSSKTGADAQTRRDLAAARVSRPSPAMKRERRLQRRLMAAGWGVFALCMIPVAVWLSRPENLPERDLEGMFTGLLRVFLPCTAAGLGAIAAALRLREKSMLRETEAAKAQLKEEKAQKPAPETAERRHPEKWLQAVLIIAAIALMIAGVFNRSAYDVLCKAITICTECIGLG